MASQLSELSLTYFRWRGLGRWGGERSKCGHLPPQIGDGSLNRCDTLSQFRITSSGHLGRCGGARDADQPIAHAQPFGCGLSPPERQHGGGQLEV